MDPTKGEHRPVKLELCEFHVNAILALILNFQPIMYIKLFFASMDQAGNVGLCSLHLALLLSLLENVRSARLGLIKNC